MSTVRFVLWNMEWMNDLFVPNDQPLAFRPDDERPSHHPDTTIRQRRNDLSGVLNELAPDVVVVVEGPNRTEELQLFFDEEVQGDWKTQVQPSKGQSQNLGVAVRLDQNKFRENPLKFHDTNNIEAFGEFTADVDDDQIEEEYKFERRPLYVEIYPNEGKAFHILGLHLKSKGIFSAYE